MSVGKSFFFEIHSEKSHLTLFKSLQQSNMGFIVQSMLSLIWTLKSERFLRKMMMYLGSYKYICGAFPDH